MVFRQAVRLDQLHAAARQRRVSNVALMAAEDREGRGRERDRSSGTFARIAAPLMPTPTVSTRFTRLDFFDLNGRLVVDDDPPRTR
jgi:hypothetical protein